MQEITPPTHTHSPSQPLCWCRYWDHYRVWHRFGLFITWKTLYFSFCCPHPLAWWLLRYAGKWGQYLYCVSHFLPRSVVLCLICIAIMIFYYLFLFITASVQGDGRLFDTEIFPPGSSNCVDYLVGFPSNFILVIIRAWWWSAHPADPGGAALCVRDQGPQPGQQGGVQPGGDQGHAPTGQGGRQESGWVEIVVYVKYKYLFKH